MSRPRQQYIALAPAPPVPAYTLPGLKQEEAPSGKRVDPATLGSAYSPPAAVGDPNVLRRHREGVLKRLEARLVKAQREITPKTSAKTKRALGLALAAVRKGDADGAVAILEEAV